MEISSQQQTAEDLNRWAGLDPVKPLTTLRMRKKFSILMMDQLPSPLGDST